MKLFRLLCLSCIALLPLNAISQPVVTYSNTSFPEPNKGWSNILLLKNGNTVFLNGNESVLLMKVFDTDRKEILTRNVPFKASVKGGVPGKEQSFKAAFEQNGNVVILVSITDGCGLGGYINCVQSLYRFVIEPATAKIISGEKLGATEKVKSWGYNLDYMVLNDIMVAKDPVSDRYAVLLFNGYTNLKITTDRVQLLTYDGSNQLLKSVVLDAPSTKDKAIHFAGLTMYDKTVYLGTNKRDTDDKGKDIPVCISVLKDGADNFETKEVNITPFAINSDNQLLFNPGSQTLQMLTTTELGKERKGGFISINSETRYDQTSGISIVDVNSMDIKSTSGIDYSLADKYAKQKLGEKNGFNGNVPSAYLNTDNTVTIIPEERVTVTRSSAGGRGYTEATYIGKIGIIKLDKDAKATESIVMRIREISGAMMSGSAAYYYFDYKYLNTPEANYIVLNDIDENFDKPETVKPHIMTTISDGNTILHKVTKNGVEKSYLFGKPEKKNETRFAMIGNSTYDTSSQTWATIVVSGKDKRAKLAWVKFE